MPVGEIIPGMGWNPTGVFGCELVGESRPPPLMISRVQMASSRASKSGSSRSAMPCLRMDSRRDDPLLLKVRMRRSSLSSVSLVDFVTSSARSSSSPPPPLIEAARDLASESPSSPAWFPSSTGMKRSSRNWSTSLA